MSVVNNCVNYQHLLYDFYRLVHTLVMDDNIKKYQIDTFKVLITN